MITQFPASKHTRENRGKNHAPPPSISMFFRVYIKYCYYQNIKIAQMKEANAQNSYRSCFKILKKQVYFSFLSRIQIDDKTTSFTFLNLGTFLSIVSHSIQCFSKKFLVATVCSSIHIFSVFLQKMQTFSYEGFYEFHLFVFTVVNQALQHCDDHLMQLKNLVSDLHRVLICFYSFSCCDFFRRHLHFRQAPHQLQEQPKIKRQINNQDRGKNY